MSDRREDLRRQFGTVWKMASDGLGTLREVVVRSSQTGRLRVDLALLAREKQQLLARMGAQLGRLIDDGAIEVPEALKQMWERVRDVDARMNMDAGRAHDNAYGAPRGYESEAGGYDDEEEEDALLENEVDEHAEMAQEKRR
ncbi:MAG TPA: hypothetical protein VN947_26160 [Polyangia bacterium]|nr:hypothetical protein [Polyangia bacterium]